jgi:hypothetical protein
MAQDGKSDTTKVSWLGKMAARASPETRELIGTNWQISSTTKHRRDT